LSLIDKPGSTRRHRIFVLYVVAMLLAFLVPTPATPLAESQHVDKLVHFGIFLGFALFFYSDRHWSAWWTFLLSIAFAGAIELVQTTLPYRQGDWLDFAAGAAGAGLGTFFVIWSQRQTARAATRSATTRKN
jgi:VanZ family protein